MKNKYMTETDIVGIKESRKRKKKNISADKSFVSMESMEELLKRDEQREKDGFAKKIKIGKVMAGPGKVIMIPYVTEEKIIHGDFEPSEDGDEGDAGKGDGEVGEGIGKKPLWGEGEDGDKGEESNGAGEGSGGEHGIEAEAYKQGKELSEKFQLPNLKDKGKKVPTDEYIYDLTDRHRGSGQLLDKKATLRRIVKTNTVLGKYDPDNVDTAKFVISPNDKIYRVLSKEKVWKSQAIVFFVRDYSGSMEGEPTKSVVTQHLMIYSWLMVQYQALVIPRFIVHDMDAKEVSVQNYFRKKSEGGTLISSGYKKVNEIVESEGLARDYNVYVFYGTDGDNFETDYKDMFRELDKILGYVNRFGVSVLRNPYYVSTERNFELLVKKANLPERKELFRMHSMSSGSVTDEQNIEAVKALIAQD